MPMVRVDHKSSVRQRVDEPVALHCLAHMEAGCGIVGTHKNELPVREGAAVLPFDDRSFQAVRQDANRSASGLQCTSHCGLVDSARPTGYDRRSRFSTEATHVFGILDQIFLDLARTDHRQPADVQYRAIPAPVEDRRGVSSHPGLQPSRIVRVGSSNDPESAGTPSLESLRQEESAAKESSNSLDVQFGTGLAQRLGNLAAQQVGRLPVDGSKPSGEIAVLGRAQWTRVRGRGMPHSDPRPRRVPAEAREQRCGQQQNRLRIRVQVAVHPRFATPAEARSQAVAGAPSPARKHNRSESASPQ